MNLEKQVCSLELAKKLKELGVKQESYFEWFTYGDKWRISDSLSNSNMEEIHSKIPKEQIQDLPTIERIPAYTVAELGEMLWDIFEKIGWKSIYTVYGDVFGFKGTSRIGELGIVNLMRNPDMSAKMLIYLLENGLIKN